MQLRRRGLPSSASPCTSRRRCWSSRWVGVAFAVLIALVLAVAANRQLVASSLAIRGPLDNLVAQVDAVAYLVTHPLLTLRVNFDPDLAPRTALDAAGYAWLVAIAALLLLGVAQLRRRAWLGFGVLWFALALLPTHGPFARLELANERQLYLALLGPGLILEVLLGSWSRRRAPPTSGRWHSTLRTARRAATSMRCRGTDGREGRHLPFTLFGAARPSARCAFRRS